MVYHITSSMMWRKRVHRSRHTIWAIRIKISCHSHTLQLFLYSIFHFHVWFHFFCRAYNFPLKRTTISKFALIFHFHLWYFVSVHFQHKNWNYIVKKFVIQIKNRDNNQVHWLSNLGCIKYSFHLQIYWSILYSWKLFKEKTRKKVIIESCEIRNLSFFLILLLIW